MNSLASVIGALLLTGICSPALTQQGGAYAPTGSPGYSPPPSSGVSFRKGVRFERLRDQNGYILRIHIRGYTPEAIQVRVQGPFLVVENRESQQVEQRDDRGGYRFTASSSNLRRRFPLPPDADPVAMQRKDEEGMVVVTIPYAGGPRN